MSILFRMVRTRTFDPSTALTQAVGLFSSKGYADTSMDDIVRATGVSRYGLYGTFGNKRELFEQALDRYAEGMGLTSTMFGLAVLGRTGFSRESLHGIVDSTLASLTG
jgi:AcrR family transcriptional regulator